MDLADLTEEAWGTLNDLLLTGNGQHNLIPGNREAGDTLLHKKQKRQDRVFCCVSHVYQSSGDNTITAVVAKDI